MLDQAQLRRKARDARRSLSDDARRDAAQVIADRVIRSAWFQRSNNIGCYIAMAEEVDTSAIIARAWRMKKRIFAPVVKKNSLLSFRELLPETSLIRDTFGVHTPTDGDTVEPRELDVVLTPLVAYDNNNLRIGMGGGHFDRTFAVLRHRKYYRRPKLIGLAFACQEVEKIPPNPWDLRLFDVITEN